MSVGQRKQRGDSQTLGTVFLRMELEALIRLRGKKKEKKGDPTSTVDSEARKNKRGVHVK